MLMMPADAFLPNKVDCGPRSTSTRLRLGRSAICAAERERYTPSMNTPTDGSIPALFAPLPKPRMMKSVLAELCSWLTRSDGTTLCKSLRSRICACSIVAPLVTETATGVSSNVCSRLVAVTMMSSRSAWVVSRSSRVVVLCGVCDAGVVSCADAGTAYSETKADAASSSNFFMMTSPVSTACGLRRMSVFSHEVREIARHSQCPIALLAQGCAEVAEMKQLQIRTNFMLQYGEIRVP